MEPEEEIDTLHPQIYSFVVEKIPEAVEAYISIAREREKLLGEMREKIKTRKVERVPPRELSGVKISAADGGGNGKALQGFYFGICTALSFTSMGLEEEDESPISAGLPVLWDDEYDPRRRVGSIRDMLMYQVSRRTIEERMPDIFLLDGPIIPNERYMPQEDDSEAYRQGYAEMMEALFSMLRAAEKAYRERRMLFAGVIKRAGSTRYQKMLGIKRHMRDPLLLNPILSEGERTELIGPGERRMLSEFPPELREVSVFFIKTSKLAPMRIEVPGWEKDSADEIASVIYSTSDPISGVPFHILRADTLTRVSLPTTDLTYSRFISRLLDKVRSGELREEDLDMGLLRRLEVWGL
jgi:hypothetical protein